MKCPRCGNQLVETVRQQILVDHCPICGGIWLDRNRIDTLLAAHATLTRAENAALSSSADPESGSRLHRGLVALLST